MRFRGFRVGAYCTTTEAVTSVSKEKTRPQDARASLAYPEPGASQVEMFNGDEGPKAHGVQVQGLGDIGSGLKLKA